MRQLVEYFENKKIDKVLDVGTGTGDFIQVLKKAFNSAVITGVDPNTASLSVAKKEYPDVLFTEMGAEQLLFPDNSFDVTSISMALHHLPDIKKAFAEMIRVTKKDGWIIVSELYSNYLNPAQEVHKLFHHFRSKTDRLLGFSHNETFKKEEILEMTEDSGIHILSHFDFKKETNLISTEGELEERVKKMSDMLETIKHLPEYGSLNPEVEQFRNKAKKHGFQPATRVVIIGQKK